MTTAAGGPTVRRIMLGMELRRLREAAGITREAAAYVIRGSESKISRLELGRVGCKTRDVADLLTLYGVDDPEHRQAWLTIAEEANLPGWWHGYDDVLPAWFQTYLGLEESASLIRSYELQFIPGLLQTEDYARAVAVSGAPHAAAEEIDRRVQLRMTRQATVSRGNPPRLWVVVDEGALRRPMGGRTVMRGQLRQLLDLVERPDVTLQVMPYRFGGYTPDGGAFSILRFASGDIPDLVYLEQLTGALYLDRTDAVERYVAAMNRLTVDSQPPERTRDLIATVLDQI